MPSVSLSGLPLQRLFEFFLFSPSPLKVLFDLKGGNEAHGVRHRVWVTKKQV